MVSFTSSCKQNFGTVECIDIFFTNEVNDTKNNDINPKNILQALENPEFKLYFSFLAYVLDIVNKINIEFQSESPKIHLLYDRVSSLYRTLLRNFIKSNYLQNFYDNYEHVKFHPQL